MPQTLVVEDLLQRIRQLTGDLEKIRQSYATTIGTPEMALRANSVLGVGSTQALVELDEAIDDLQHVVWLYVETANSRGPRNAPSSSKLLSRASDILYALSTHPPLPRQESNPNTASFVERLIKLMEGPHDSVHPPEASTDKAPALHFGAEQSRV